MRGRTGASRVSLTGLASPLIELVLQTNPTKAIEGIMFINYPRSEKDVIHIEPYYISRRDRPTKGAVYLSLPRD